MRRFIALIALAFGIGWLTGCKTVTANTPVAPGYQNATDQTLGQDLAALNGAVQQEVKNYQADPASLQAAEKTALNAFITATNLANAAYTAYHAGTGTLQAAQTAVTNAQNAQTALMAAKGAR